MLLATTHQPEDSSPDEHARRPRLLILIVIGIVLGAGVGGLAPSFAVRVSLLGTIFLNLLMMLVIPLVMLSMIVGITGLGDVRHLGSIGWRTLLYYTVTTGIVVMIGIVVVNVINPGRDVSPGEDHPQAAYAIAGEDNHTVTLAEARWDRGNYSDKYVLVLSD